MGWEWLRNWKKQLPDETDSRFLRDRHKSVGPSNEIKLINMKLLLNFVSFNYSCVRMCLGVCHWDILAIFGTPGVLNVLGLVHNFFDLKITWDWNKFFVHFKCSCTMVTSGAKWNDVPSLISTVCFLYMCTNQVSPVMTICCTASISLMACVLIPII